MLPRVGADDIHQHHFRTQSEGDNDEVLVGATNVRLSAACSA